MHSIDAQNFTVEQSIGDMDLGSLYLMKIEAKIPQRLKKLPRITREQFEKYCRQMAVQSGKILDRSQLRQIEHQLQMQFCRDQCEREMAYLNRWHQFIQNQIDQRAELFLLSGLFYTLAVETSTKQSLNFMNKVTRDQSITRFQKLIEEEQAYYSWISENSGREEALDTQKNDIGLRSYVIEQFDTKKKKKKEQEIYQSMIRRLATFPSKQCMPPCQMRRMMFIYGQTLCHRCFSEFDFEYHHNKWNDFEEPFLYLI